MHVPDRPSRKFPYLPVLIGVVLLLVVGAVAWVLFLRDGDTVRDARISEYSCEELTASYEEYEFDCQGDREFQALFEEYRPRFDEFVNSDAYEVDEAEDPRSLALYGLYVCKHTANPDGENAAARDALWAWYYTLQDTTAYDLLQARNHALTTLCPEYSDQQVTDDRETAEQIVITYYGAATDLPVIGDRAIATARNIAGDEFDNISDERLLQSISTVCALGDLRRAVPARANEIMMSTADTDDQAFTMDYLVDHITSDEPRMNAARTAAGEHLCEEPVAALG